MLGLHNDFKPSVDAEDLDYGFDDTEIVYVPGAWYPSDSELLKFHSLCKDKIRAGTSQDFLITCVAVIYIWFSRKYSKTARMRKYTPRLRAFRSHLETYKSRMHDRATLDDLYNTDIKSLYELIDDQIDRCSIVFETRRNLSGDRGLLEQRSLIETLIVTWRNASITAPSEQGFAKFLGFMINYAAVSDRQKHLLEDKSMYLKTVARAHHLITRYKNQVSTEDNVFRLSDSDLQSSDRE